MVYLKEKIISKSKIKRREYFLFKLYDPNDIYTFRNKNLIFTHLLFHVLNNLFLKYPHKFHKIFKLIALIKILYKTKPTKGLKLILWALKKVSFAQDSLKYLYPKYPKRRQAIVRQKIKLSNISWYHSYAQIKIS